MGETRNPALGSWTLFEGDSTVAQTPRAALDLFAAAGARRVISEPLTWPITLRVSWIRDGVIEGVDVEVADDLSVAVTQERVPMRHDGGRARMRRMTGEWTAWEPGMADETDERIEALERSRGVDAAGLVVDDGVHERSPDKGDDDEVPAHD